MKRYEHNGFGLDYHKTPWASHQLPLIHAVEGTSGDVLELGMGRFSTPLLRHLLLKTGRGLVSLESDKEWFGRFQTGGGSDHEVRLVEDWVAAIDEAARRMWGVVFVDQAPEVMRYYSVLKLLDWADVIVVHDADRMDQLRDGPYHWFRYVPLEKAHRGRRGPPTFLISKSREVGELRDLCVGAGDEDG